MVASALDPGLDLATALFDPRGAEIYSADDDSGPGSDALLEGVRLPHTGPYAISVFSPIADVDPTIGTGRYRVDLSLCNNTGADLDGDGLVDTCDGDEDGDGFTDAIDLAPRDAVVCFDIDDDGCNDCVNGAFDPFDDGLDSDGDSLCDSGDPDDDNDGCSDTVDSSPLSPSVDPDLDFVGAHCDNCSDQPNPDLEDCNGNGAGDACDPIPCPAPRPPLLIAAALLALARLRRTAATRAVAGKRSP